ncbi:S-adenosyl-L-methionine-dependent methyltransferase [Baffinella frigidus]|nr:S-adenosyl-L-methionine-dependent methyltransferase [Cryptophyta sp. CCMP2293]
MPEAQQITEATLGHYSRRAVQFYEGTKDHDVSQNRAALLRHLPSDRPLRLLDLGCGPGRDVQYFTGLGHEVTGLDGCKEFVDMCQKMCPTSSTLQQDLHSLDLPTQHFDGIFANAALFHVKRSELQRVLGELKAAVAPNGVIFVSNPRSMQDQDMENGGNSEDMRYGHYQTLESWRAVCGRVGLEELEHYYRPPGRPVHEQPWLASVWRCP